MKPVAAMNGLDALRGGSIAVVASSEISSELDVNSVLPLFQKYRIDPSVNRAYVQFGGVRFDVGPVEKTRCGPAVYQRLIPAPRAEALIVNRRGHEILLADGGEVINFGGPDPIPAEYIQLTRGLLYLASIQAARTTRPGLHDLDLGAQRWLVREVSTELYRASKGSLLYPSF